jgi:glycosyltransferase involved in cell wall biosynthesis
MKLLITMKLANRSLKYHIYPITSLKEIDKILIVRDTTGPKMNKVKYYCPPKWTLRFPVLALFFKFLLMIYLSIREKPALIHSYLLFPHGFLAFLVGKLTRRKVGVSLIAGPMELYVLGGSPVEKYAYTKPLPELPVKGKIILSILKRFDVVVVAGSFTKKFLLERGINENKIFTVPYVVIDNRCLPLQLTKIYDLIYIGRLAEVKHIEIVLHITNKLVREFGLSNLKVAIVGDGPCSEKLRKLCKKGALENNVEFLGFKEDIATYFNRSKLSIVTSERETGPLTVIESMMCGVPVIASRCSDTIIDLLRDGYNGSVIDDYQNVNSFAKVIIKLLQNPKVINMYSANAFKTAEKINTEKVAYIWENVINRIGGNI